MRDQEEAAWRACGCKVGWRRLGLRKHIRNRAREEEATKGEVKAGFLIAFFAKRSKEF